MVSFLILYLINSHFTLKSLVCKVIGSRRLAISLSASSIYSVFKMIGIQPMATVVNTGPLEGRYLISEHKMLSFSVRKEIIKNDNSLVVILLSKVVENEFFQTCSQFTK